MSKDEKDILTGLEGLEKMPYRIPEGYFDGLEARIHARIAEKDVPARRRPLRDRLFRRTAYLSAAAVLGIIAAGGLLMLRNTVQTDDYGAERYAMYQDVDIIPVTDPESVWLSSYDEEASDALSTEDIINYLVYIGIEPEEFDNE